MSESPFHNMHELRAPNQKPVVILTGTVIVRDMPSTARTDTDLRLADYKRAFQRWIADPAVQSLVFVENSGFPLTDFEALARTHPEKEIELLSFTCPGFDPALGKGYGEMLILQHALQHSKLISNSHQFLKATGRYYLHNADTMLQFLASNPKLDVVCDLIAMLTWADSRAFGGRIEFLREYLLPRQGDVDESKNICFETVLARAIHQVMADGGNWTLPPEVLKISGVSATSNAGYSTSRLKLIALKLLFRAKQILFARPSKNQLT